MYVDLLTNFSRMQMNCVKETRIKASGLVPITNITEGFFVLWVVNRKRIKTVRQSDVNTAAGPV